MAWVIASFRLRRRLCEAEGKALRFASGNSGDEPPFGLSRPPRTAIRNTAPGSKNRVHLQIHDAGVMDFQRIAARRFDDTVPTLAAWTDPQPVQMSFA
jgi:hypothetical protein